MAQIKDTSDVRGRGNRLVDEKSPYLLQHAYNPVEWFPWDEAAFETARKQDKPIFLSIGYSTCHWCHVMEKESFEDPEVAALMNETFISIKVDREERPDLDHVYMAVCQALTGRGGWPLTILMTPEKKPFYAGTYIPKENRFGQPGLMALIPQIRTLWTERRVEILRSAEEILKAMKGMAHAPSAGNLERTILDRAYEEFEHRFDAIYGGFGQAPKFPSPHNLLFLLRHWKRTGRPEALKMVEKTLREMRHGGICDQIGYGFHRYSTDREWLVPHFEKMLYDQALLCLAYLETYQATGDSFYSNTAEEILIYVLRDMTSPDGGFYSAEDADSEGVEGRFYIWKEEELRKILAKEEANLICRVFNVKEQGNFHEEASRKKTGANILYLGKGLPEIAHELNLLPEILEDRIAAAREILFRAREDRIHPHKDDKILTDWNGLMIAAFARGAKVLGDDRYAETAEKAADFIMTVLRREDGRLLHRYRDGGAGIAAHLDDYAFFVWGLIELYEATYEARFLRTALEINRDMLRHFWDHDHGGLFFAAQDSERLILRNKEAYDGAIPSGNGVAMLNLLRLARLTGDAELEKTAAAIGEAFSGQIKQMPSAFTQFLAAYDFALGPSHEVVIVGPTGSEETMQMLSALQTSYNPSLVTLFRPSGQEDPEIEEIAPFIRSYSALGGKATAYVCRDHSCSTPTTDVNAMLKILSREAEGAI